jgi:hypothetical protein
MLPDEGHMTETYRGNNIRKGEEELLRWRTINCWINFLSYFSSLFFLLYFSVIFFSSIYFIYIVYFYLLFSSSGSNIFFLRHIFFSINFLFSLVIILDPSCNSCNFTFVKWWRRPRATVCRPLSCILTGTCNATPFSSFLPRIQTGDWKRDQRRKQDKRGGTRTGLWDGWQSG